MLDFPTLMTYIIVVLGLFLIPGPAVLLTITRTVQNGRRGGIMAGLGIATGDFLHTLFATVGLSAILMTSALAFNVVKFAGAAYLLYLGIRAILSKPSEPQMPQVESAGSLKSYVSATVAELLNPKTALFFLAFLPQFIHHERGEAVGQFLVLGLIFVILSILYTTTIVLSVSTLGRVVKRTPWIRRLSQWSGKFVGAIYIGLGLKVAFQRQ
ncbi:MULTISPECIES: LysE family translocator [Paenibacillus]|uniref:Lysine exporter protein (LYSE/YGGA) n=2 Tax=Paenibacillus lactis TaxID=228574 RepID=G4H911_9BACL|nr:LysE family translocator [Paenibacillus lactis]EHB68346.1 Lysine exporter protein (LYSE/YGGA) [Paenibacillus lactis 154]MBP1894296.1 threonine/homoserine/homoserine lactone efflux protein [Paenibacillus lactis]GIO91221.1 lysine transporter LysE [Paenibacillus lactis]HAF99528.1 LysE family translocator [Paenibacillus lactis]